jgi:hypothetical protein
MHPWQGVAHGPTIRESDFIRSSVITLWGGVKAAANLLHFFLPDAGTCQLMLVPGTFTLDITPGIGLGTWLTKSRAMPEIWLGFEAYNSGEARL